MAQRNDPYVGVEILGQYQIERRLGEGGMGMVYLADQPAMARKAAIKILRPEIASEEQMERFQREAQTLSHIDHPHIVKVYNFGTLDQGELYIAMEFVQGKEMDQVLEEEGRLDHKRALDIAIQTADALVEAHAKGIVHRDLKPENVMLCERRGNEDYVKVMDFGIAKVLESSQVLESSATVAGVIHGTPQYMSPEQARGEAVDHRSDIYSLGIVLYAMLTGDLPIKSNTLVGYIIAHQQDPPAPLATHNVQVPKRVEQILFRMLEKKIDARYQTMQEVLNDLRAVLAPPPPPTRSHRGAIIGLVALLVTLAAAGAGAYFLGLFDFGGQTKAPVIRHGLAAGVVEASDNQRPKWIKRPPPTKDKTYVVGRGEAGVKTQARDAAQARAMAKLLQKAASLVLADSLEASALRTWTKAAKRVKLDEGQRRLLAEALRKATALPRLGDSEQDYWEKRRPASGASQYHYWRLFGFPVARLTGVTEGFLEHETYYGMRAIPMFPLVAPLVGASTGVVLSKVKSGGLVNEAGVQQGDLVVRVNGQAVDSPKDFVGKVRRAVTQGKRSGEPLTLDVVRLVRGKVEQKKIVIARLK